LADAVGLDRDARECHLEPVEWTSHGLPRLAHDAVDRNDDRFARRGAETHVPVPERILSVDDVRPELVQDVPQEASSGSIEREVVEPRGRRNVSHRTPWDSDFARHLRRRDERDHVQLDVFERGETVHEVHERRLDTARDEAWVDRIRSDERDAHAWDDYHVGWPTLRR